MTSTQALDTQEERRKKRLSLIDFASRGTAKFMICASALTAITALPAALIPGLATQFPVIALIAGSIGVEALGIVLEKVAFDDTASDEEKIRQITEAIDQSGIGRFYEDNREAVLQITQLDTWQQQIIDALQSNKKDVAERLFLISIDITRLQDQLEQLATREQGEQILDEVRQLAHSLTDRTELHTKNGHTTPAIHIPNPFGYSGRIQDSERYLPREPFTQQIIQELQKGQSISLVGESQSGKSSLLWSVYSNGIEFLLDEFSLVQYTNVVYLTMELIHNEDDFFEYLCDELGLSDVKRGWRLSNALRGQRILVCLDEIEKMTWSGFTRKIRTELRGLADGIHQPLNFLIATRSSLFELFPDSLDAQNTSPLANLCLEIAMPAFSQLEAKELAAMRLVGHDVSLPPHLIEQAWRESQGHAGHLQTSLKNLFHMWHSSNQI